MRKIIFGLIIVLMVISTSIFGQEQLIYHRIKTDKEGKILPWFNNDPGISYDHIVNLVWNFWDTMGKDMNGLPYYMNHQVWRPDFNDPRGLGGDQIQMAMSSWQLLYAYSGNERVKENMRFLADYYLTNGLSPAHSKWPNIPYPYNTLVYSGKYDGDMVIGMGFTQPDKAGSFGLELIKLFKMMSNERYPHATEKRYLQAAIEIANTLASHIKEGDADHSPMPFKVNATTGEVGKLKSNSGDKSEVGLSSYTSNWSGTVELFLQLISLNEGSIDDYRKSADIMISWMKTYPMKTNKWGPFFEDIPGWSDTQINAMTWARFIMTHRELFPDWRSDVQSIIDWVNKILGNNQWEKYGVTAINEQTAYRTPGNSHTSRQAADELLFYSLTGDSNRIPHAVRQLNWATYMVDSDGKNRYPRDENWLTDGYGDYLRHYLRAMAAFPQLAPYNQNHILSSTSIIQLANYRGMINKFLVPVVRKDTARAVIYYRTYDSKGMEVLRLTKKPSAVLLDEIPLKDLKDQTGEGYTWQPIFMGGILSIWREHGNKVTVIN
ncbi:MAG: hypothetical protein ABIR15_02480 [Chitinophagaceae bacterium]